jgi:GNAT superfamily N-acetyltransferase
MHELALPERVAFLRFETEPGVVTTWVDETTGPVFATVMEYRFEDDVLVLTRMWTAPAWQGTGCGKITIASVLKAAHDDGVTLARCINMTSVTETVARGAVKIDDHTIELPMPGTGYDWLQSELLTF